MLYSLQKQKVTATTKTSSDLSLSKYSLLICPDGPFQQQSFTLVLFYTINPDFRCPLLYSSTFSFNSYLFTQVLFILQSFNRIKQSQYDFFPYCTTSLLHFMNTDTHHTSHISLLSCFILSHMKEQTFYKYVLSSLNLLP